MDKTICSNHLTVPSDDDVPFADERHRYLRHCEEVGMTARSLKGKRNELLWIATRLSPDAYVSVRCDFTARETSFVSARCG
jgi:integrase/recombinase XerD